MKNLWRKIAVISVASAAATSEAFAQRAGDFQPLTVIAPTTFGPTSRPSSDQVLRSVFQQLRSRVENNAVLQFQPIQKLTKYGPSPNPHSVTVSVTIHTEPMMNANGDPAMPSTLEWYVAGPLSCPTPRPRVHGSLP